MRGEKEVGFFNYLMRFLLLAFTALFLTGCRSSAAPEKFITLPLSIDSEQKLELSLTKEAPKNDPQLSSNLESSKPSIQGENSKWSLVSFFNQNFEGNNFSIGKLLQDWGTHKSYYASYQSQGLKISATFHVPDGEGPFPVLILNHGYFPPQSYTNGYGFGREQKHFARLGYAVLHIDYRGYAFSDQDPDAIIGRRFGYTGYSTDAINAILALQQARLDYLDLSRVGMFGHSLGGGVTLQAALARPDLIKAAVLWGPISANNQDNFEKWNRSRMTPQATKVFTDAFGSIDDPDSFLALSPLTYLDRLKVPLLIQHGTADESCPIEWSRTLEAALRANGADYEYLEYEGYPHVFWNEHWNQVMQETQAFLAERL